MSKRIYLKSTAFSPVRLLNTLYESPDIIAKKDVVDQYKGCLKAIARGLDIGKLISDVKDNNVDIPLMRKNLSNFVVSGTCLD